MVYAENFEREGHENICTIRLISRKAGLKKRVKTFEFIIEENTGQNCIPTAIFRANVTEHDKTIWTNSSMDMKPTFLFPSEKFYSNNTYANVEGYKSHNTSIITSKLSYKFRTGEKG